MINDEKENIVDSSSKMDQDEGDMNNGTIGGEGLAIPKNDQPAKEETSEHNASGTGTAGADSADAASGHA